MDRVFRLAIIVSFLLTPGLSAQGLLNSHFRGFGPAEGLFNCRPAAAPCCRPASTPLSIPATTPTVGSVPAAPQSMDCQHPSYELQEGDMLLFQSRSVIMNGLGLLTFSVGTTHATIVVKRCDGTLATLETPYVGTRVQLLDISRVNRYPGRVWVRRPHQPLNAEQSAQLTSFAYAQLGKRYDFYGFFVLPVAWPTRSPWTFSPRDYNTTSSWYCASIALGGACAAGLADPNVVSPRGVCPDDLRRDWWIDLSQSYTPATLILQN